MAILNGIEYTREDVIQAIQDLENNKYNESDFKTQDIRNSDYRIVWQEKLYAPKRVFECLAKNKNIEIGCSFQPSSLIPQLKEMGFEIKQQAEFENRKNGFLKYLKNVVLPTVPSYKNYIKKFDLDKVIMHILKKDIFAVLDTQEIETIFTELKENEEWNLYNKQNGNGIPAAILRKHLVNYIENNAHKYWLYAAGEKSLKWEEFYNNGIMALGWDYLGDYKQYDSQESLAAEIQKHRNDNSYPTNDSKATWEFANEMNVGDIVYVKQGLEPILLGRGVVTSEYIYDFNREEYKSIRQVNWTHKGIFNVNFEELEIQQWNQKTLTDISENKYGTFCKKIESIFEDKNKINSEKNKMNNQPLNQILYGPPGTGKTYSTKGLVNSIIKNNFISSKKTNINVNELYWYSAIALSMYQNDKNKKYKVRELLQQEVIKEFAESKNSKNVYSTVISQLQMHTDENSETVNYARRLSPYIFNKDENSEWYLTEEGCTFVEESFKDILFNNDAVNKNCNNNFVKFITFHQAYSYEEFVEGIRVNVEDDCEDVKYTLQNGIFKDICIEANADPNNNYVIIIDEINRGDISKIFGELITLIEKDKRVTPNGERNFTNTKLENNQLLITLPYSKKPFGVPSNLYIIGTMNTADRSIALLDIALRRRFDFISTYPNEDVIGTDGALTEINGIDLKLFLNKINKRIEAYLDKDHTIGHSYLMDINSYEDFEYKFKNRILPLLLEYFYNDYEKVAKILNQDDFDNSEKQIILKECLIEDIPTYEINEKYPIEAFKEVCK